LRRSIRWRRPRPLSWRTMRRYRAVATGGAALLDDQETLTVFDFAS
jgi:hypothetical protein